MRTAHCWLLSVILIGGCSAAAEPQRKPQDQSEDIAAAAGQLVQRLADGDYSTVFKDFDDAMRKAAPPEKLKQIWESTVAQSGPLKKQMGTRTERVAEYDAVFVTCQFEKAKFDVQVVFNRSKQISGLFFVATKAAAVYQQPPYSSPTAYREREVQVGTGQWSLPGTLTVPLGDGPFPAVVLVHGSGPNDRDETIGPNKPFCDLAWGLASRGVAVLRYEKRTKQHAAKLAAIIGTLTVKEETIDDALAAVSLLRGAEKIAPTRIFVLGHSLGGMLVPRIGTLDTRIAGFIVMAGASRPLEDIIYGQFKDLYSLNGPMSEADKAKLRELERQVAMVKGPELSAKTPPSDLPLGGVWGAYWLDLRGYSPPEVARGMKCPILILQGGRDYQVGPADYQGWKNALASHANVQFKLYPKLNHLFAEGEGRSTPAEYEIPNHVAEVVIDDIAKWIKQQ